MKNLQRYSLRLAIFLAALFVLSVDVPAWRHTEREVVNLHFTSGVDGQAILAHVDEFLEKAALPSPSGELVRDFERTAGGESEMITRRKKTSPVSVENIIPQTLPNPLLAPLWNNTAMIFGATADGIGVGTGVAVRSSTPATQIFVTALHVVESFCDIPEQTLTDTVSQDSTLYPCRALFVLHDIAIDTSTNQVDSDGPKPWKTPIEGLFYFDKKLDLAVFEVAVPEDHGLNPAALKTAYDIKDPKFFHIDAQLLPGVKLTLQEQNPMTPLSLLRYTVYLVSFPAMYKNKPTANLPDPQIIRKRWTTGKYIGTRTFENDRKLGFIAALKHSIPAFPGSSGAPLVLSDGRIVGINTSLQLIKYYAKKGCSRRLETRSENYAVPTAYLQTLFPENGGNKP